MRISVNRRGFLALAGAAAIGCSKKAEEPPAKPRLRWRTAIGLNGFGSSERLYHKRYPFDDILAFGKKEGFEGIELWAPYLDGYPDPADDKAIQSLRQKVEAYSLQIFSIQAATPGQNPIAEEAEARQKYTDALKGQILLAKKLGCDCAGVWPPPLKLMAGQTEEQMIERLAGSLKPAVAFAHDQGIALAIEGEPPLVIHSPELYEKLFAAVGEPELKVIFDPAHFDLLTGGNHQPDLLVRQLGVGRIGYVQFTDGDGTLRRQPGGASGTSKHIAPGDGKYDLYQLLTLLRDGGYSGWIQVDAWETEDPYYASKAGKDIIDAARNALLPRA